MRTHSLIAACLAVWSAAAGAVAQGLPAEPGLYRIDPARSSIRWKIDQVPHSAYTGAFEAFDATLRIDPARPDTAELEVVIDPRSIRTDFLFADRFDDELSDDPEFFDAPNFPRITFVSTRVERVDATRAMLAGDLTLLGITRPVTLDVRLAEPVDAAADTLRFEAEGRLKRSAFGIVTRLYVADAIRLLIEAEFDRAAD